jgi:hypothetical protein
MTRWRRCHSPGKRRSLGGNLACTGQLCTSGTVHGTIAAEYPLLSILKQENIMNADNQGSSRNKQGTNVQSGGKCAGGNETVTVSEPNWLLRLQLEVPVNS